MKEDLLVSYNDGSFSQDSEVPDERLSELELTDEASGKLDEITEDFVSNDAADLTSFTDFTDQDMSSAGADAYLSVQGVGFRDRIPDDRAIAARQAENLSQSEGMERNKHLNEALNTIERSGVRPVNGPGGAMDVHSTMEKIVAGDAPSAKARQAAERLDEAAVQHFQGALENMEITDDGDIDF